MRAVSVVVVGVFVVVNEIVAFGKFGLRQIRYAMILPFAVFVIFRRHAGINHRHNRAFAIGMLPGVFDFDHLHVPLFVIHRIIRLAVGFVEVIRLGVFNQGVIGQ